MINEAVFKYLVEHGVNEPTGDSVLREPEGGAFPRERREVDLTFFKVGARPSAKPEEFLALVEANLPEILDGAEHNFQEIGVKVGDQGAALMLMGLGGCLGLWDIMSPETVLPDAATLDPELKRRMAASGLVTMRFYQDRVEEREARLAVEAGRVDETEVVLDDFKSDGELRDAALEAARELAEEYADEGLTADVAEGLLLKQLQGYIPGQPFNTLRTALIGARVAVGDNIKELGPAAWA